MRKQKSTKPKKKYQGSVLDYSMYRETNDFVLRAKTHQKPSRAGGDTKRLKATKANRSSSNQAFKKRPGWLGLKPTKSKNYLRKSTNGSGKAKGSVSSGSRKFNPLQRSVPNLRKITTSGNGTGHAKVQKTLPIIDGKNMSRTQNNIFSKQPPKTQTKYSNSLIGLSFTTHISKERAPTPTYTDEDQTFKSKIFALKKRSYVIYEPLFPYVKNDKFGPEFIFDNHLSRKKQLSGFRDKKRILSMDQFYGINNSDYKINWEGEEGDFEDVLKSIKIGSKIGQGTNCEVFEGFSYKKNKLVAIKTFIKAQKTGKERAAIEKEINIMLRMNHPNVIKVHKVMEDHLMIYVVMNFLGKFNLQEYFNQPELRENKGLRKIRIRQVAKDLTNGLNYLHTLKYCHRNLTLQNVMFYKGRAVIIDFGLASMANKEKKRYDLAGSLEYFAPDMLKGEGYSGQAVDVWCLGVILYYLLTGKFPFGVSDSEWVKKNILEHAPFYGVAFNPIEKDFVSKLLDKYARRRPNIKMIRDQLYVKD